MEAKKIRFKPGGWKNFLENFFVSGWKQKVAKKMKTGGWKQKSCWNIWKPVVETKKVAEKSENSWKQKSCWKNLSTSGWKQKSCWNI